MKSGNTASLRTLPDDESHLREALAQSEHRLQCLIELSSDYYWETDEDLRFTHVRHQASDGRVTGFIGKATWELGAIPVHGTWDEYRELRAAHLPFTDFLVRRPDADGRDVYLSASGRPMFAADGRFRGYQGITRDVTRQVRDERLRTLDRTVAGILADAADLQAGLTSVIRAICESESWEAGHYWCVQDERSALRVCATWSVPGAAIESMTAEVQKLRGVPGIGLVGTVLQTAKSLWVADLGNDSRVAHRDLARRTECNSAFLFPVLSKGKPIGVLDFNARRIPEPDDGLLHVIHMLGTQIGAFYDRARALEQLRASEELFSNTVELAAIGISHVAKDGRFIHVNRSLCDMLGYTREELLALNVKQVSHSEDQNVTDEAKRRLLAGETDSIRVEKRYLRKDGTPIWVRINVALNRAADGTPLHDISAVEDISERKRVEERVQYLATHDEMTGLPNRTMFAQLLSHAIQRARRKRTSKVAVLFVDLDRFKIVNDSLGHEAGDELLKQVAARFRDCLRASDVLARLGGDEFVVLLEEGKDAQEAAQVARKLLSAAIQPIEIMGQECRVTASIGISTFPDDAGDAQALMKNADAAMYLAKEEGKNNYQFHSRSTNALSIERLALETNLRRALERDEFKLQYQPQVAAATGEITGAEALLRWWNHELGTVPPARFIPLAEDTGLIVAIGRWVLNTACAQNVAWQRAGLPPIRMAVNISPRQFKDQNLIRDIAAALEQSGMAPELLELEITEGVIMHDVNQAVRQLHAIKAMGVRLAIDDFGTGYSSLAQLKRLPIDTLKVDRSFIREIPRDPEDKAITEAVIAMGKTLGVTVVAEGVETADQREFLSSRACNELQGFLFSKPCHPDALAELLRSKMSARRA
ncbi:MAG TPA: EAL domain-containing protein [Gammaproteobacteria bacterium]|jgi:diguanylate cyclase (GGDEF)-like protein/PAS domain S-box-containing protein